MLKQYKNNYKLINNLDDKCKILKNIIYHNKYKNTGTRRNEKLGQIL